MRRVALALALSIALVASVAPAAKANSAWYFWSHFKVVNTTGMVLNYEFSFDGGWTWTPVTLAPGYWNLQWQTAPQVHAKVRFDADLGPGLAWRTYDVSTATTSWQPDGNTPTMSYRLAQSGPQLLDLFQA
jgi:hypothetical protein